MAREHEFVAWGAFRGSEEAVKALPGSVLDARTNGHPGDDGLSSRSSGLDNQLVLGPCGATIPRLIGGLRSFETKDSMGKVDLRANRVPDLHEEVLLEWMRGDDGAADRRADELSSRSVSLVEDCCPGSGTKANFVPKLASGVAMVFCVEPPSDHH